MLLCSNEITTTPVGVSCELVMRSKCTMLHISSAVSLEAETGGPGRRGWEGFPFI